MGNENGTAYGTGTGLSLQPFYTSGPDGEFVLANGAYQPTIAMTVRFELFAWICGALHRIGMCTYLQPFCTGTLHRAPASQPAYSCHDGVSLSCFAAVTAQDHI